MGRNLLLHVVIGVCQVEDNRPRTVFVVEIVRDLLEARFFGFKFFHIVVADDVVQACLLFMALGLVGFVFDTVGGVFFAKLLNLFSKKKVNPMIGAAGISAFPMASRMVHKLGRDEDPYNFLLMHAAGANVSGQIASVIAGGLIITLVENLL